MNNQVEQAYEKCEALAASHYENFPVAKMVPRHLRKHVAAVYAFARTADDIADENHETITEDDPVRVQNLEKFEAQLDLPQRAGFSPPATAPLPNFQSPNSSSATS